MDPAQLLYDILSYLNKRMNFRFLKIPAGKFFALGKISTGILTFVVEYFQGHYKFRPKRYMISSVWSILREISGFRCLCLLKVLGHFAKNWFGKTIRLQLFASVVFMVYTRWKTAKL